jgi:indolepyruvate ferredoxin oxidoreductase alpha subunit
MELRGKKIGVVTASVAYQYAREAFPEDASFLKLGLTYPLPMALIRRFASQVETLYVVEELEPFMETEIRAAGIPCRGKELTGKLYELNAQLLRERIFGIRPETKSVPAEAVSRPPALCPGCPHRGFFYTLSKNKNFVITGDIGCYTLGSAAPLNCMDVCICMGGGFSAGMGMAKAFEQAGVTDKKVFGVMGDSTFFHSGMTGAAEIIYNKGHLIPCILDNRITGMTGQQDNPGSGYTLQGEPADTISIEKVLEAYGYQNIFVVDPQDLDAMQKAVDGALASPVPAAIVTRRPCLLLKRAHRDQGRCRVDSERCRGCRKCLKVGCPAVAIRDGKAHIDAAQCVGCTVCAQVCPFGAIEKEAE